MRAFLNLRCAVFSTVLFTPAIIAPASAFSGPGLQAATATAAVIKVHDRWNDDENYRDHHWRHHHRQHDDVVDAPFTHVETGHRVIVDAPFAHVAVGAYGRHVVAPFVDLWVPR